MAGSGPGACNIPITGQQPNVTVNSCSLTCRNAGIGRLTIPSATSHQIPQARPGDHMIGQVLVNTLPRSSQPRQISKVPKVLLKAVSKSNKKDPAKTFMLHNLDLSVIRV